MSYFSGDLFTMLVNARLSYILIDGSLYSLRGQVILTINLLGVASPLDRLRVTLSNRDRTRLNKTSIITIYRQLVSIQR
jgi:hypothetical protein